MEITDNSFVFFAAGVVIAAVLFYTLSRRNKPAIEKDAKELEMKLTTIEAVMKQMGEENFRQFSQIRQDVTSNLKVGHESLSRSSEMNQRMLQDFTKNITEMKGALENVHNSVKDTTGKMNAFQDIFKTPQRYGPWGESSLHHLLTQRYPEELILKQHHFSNGEAVDFALKLPNNLLLPIDSKFPKDAFQNYIDAIDPADKEAKRKAFAQKVKSDVEDIYKKYVRPEEGTTNFALMYIPAESMYYELMFKLSDLNVDEYAKSKSIAIVSPNTLYMTLRIFEDWHRDVSIQKQTQELIKRLGTIKIDARKLEEGFDRLGKHLQTAVGSYDDSKKRLFLMTDRVDKVIKIGNEKELPAPIE